MPREIAAHLQLADACERTGRIARLTEAYRAVVALAPDDPEYAFRLGKAYLRLSQQAYRAHPGHRSAGGAPQPGARRRVPRPGTAAARAAWRSRRRRPGTRGSPRCTSRLPSSLPMTDDGTTPLARSRSSSPCSPPAARRWRCGRASTRRGPRGGRDAAMPAWLLRAVACGSLLAVPATAGAQEPPPRAAIEALAGVAHPRPAPASAGAGELERALAAKDWPRAEQLLAQAIERSPRSAALLKQIAGVFLADRRPLNAAIALKKAEALAPLDPESRFRLVLAYVAMGQREWARPELERLVAAAPDDRDLSLLARTARLRRRAVRRRGRAPAGGRDPRPVVSPHVRQPRPLLRGAEPDRSGDRAVSRSGPPESPRRRSVAMAGHQPRQRAGARRRLRGGRDAAARGDPHRSGGRAGAVPSRHGAGTDEPAGRCDPGAARRRRRRSRLRRPALRAGPDLPAAGTDRRRRRRAGRASRHAARPRRAPRPELRRSRDRRAPPARRGGTSCAGRTRPAAG